MPGIESPAGRLIGALHISRISVPSKLESLNRITVDSQKTTIFFLMTFS